MSEPNRPNTKRPLTIPTWLIYLLVFAVVMSWVPLALLAKARADRSAKPRVEGFQDMDIQPRFGPQAYAGGASAQLRDDLFADRRAMRPPVPGAVSVQFGPRLDDHKYRGYKTDGNLNAETKTENDATTLDFLAGFPEDVPITRELLDRGRQRYNIYCALCHGEAGFGDGPVHRRIERLVVQAVESGGTPPAEGWNPPRNLHQDNIVAYPEGRLFHVISEGYVSMRGYKEQISVEDRWAIVAWIRVLQASRRVDVAYATQKLGVSTDGIPDPPPKSSDAIETTAGELEDAALIARGKALFHDPLKLCATCHQVDASAPPPPTGIAVVAPPFIGSFWGAEREVHVGIGGPIEKVAMDEQYTFESIKNPMAKIRKGSQPGMIQLPLTDDEIKALVAYIKSLSE